MGGMEMGYPGLLLNPEELWSWNDMGGSGDAVVKDVLHEVVAAEDCARHFASQMRSTDGS